MSTSDSESINAFLNKKMKERSQKLALSAEQRRAERDINVSSSENSDYFSKNFLKMRHNLEDEINNAENINKENMITFLDNLVVHVGKMQQFLNESSMFLASFQIKKSQETINDLNNSVQTCIQNLQPKKKFGFKTKKTAVNKKNVLNEAESQDPIDNAVRSSHSVSAQLKEDYFFGYKGIVGETLIKSSSQLKSKQFHLQDLSDCKVIALGNPGSLQFSNLHNTTVIVGPTSRSAFIKNCIDCHFVLACQQVRIHDSRSCHFYLHVTGAAIIENCSEVHFGPYTLQYEGLDSHFAESGLATDANRWKEVEDFRWLNEDEKSPNFSLIEENDWKTNWIN